MENHNGKAATESTYASAAQLSELDRQLQRGSLFTQATMQRGFERIGNAEGLIAVLMRTLIEKGVVSADELGVTIEGDDAPQMDPSPMAPDEGLLELFGGDEGASLAQAMDLEAAEGASSPSQITWPSIAIRVDPEDGPPEPTRIVDCDARMHVCHAVCCRLKFPLNTQEIDSGHVKWDIGHPYIIRQESDGRCTHNDAATGHCGVYEHRPLICRRYSCVNDPRVWKDFDNMVLNQEWIDEHLGGNDLQVSVVVPKIDEPETWDPGHGGQS